MKKPSQQINQVLQDLRRLVRDDQHGKLVVCCSGGPDSMALLFCAQLVFVNLRVVHVLHDMRSREEALRDCEVVREYAAKTNTKFDLLEVKLRDSDGVCGSEGQYREQRYRKIIDFCKSINYQYAATAHHADDQLETVLMKLCRGAGLRGMSGIAPSNWMQDVCFVRPMLQLSKAEIYDICNENDVPFVEDETNDDTQYFRNAIRHDIIPKLKEIAPHVSQHAVAFAENAAQAQQIVNSVSDTILQEMKATGLPTDILIQNSDVVIYECIRKMIEQKRSDFNFDKLNRIMVNKIIHALRNRYTCTFDLQNNIKIVVERNFINIIL